MNGEDAVADSDTPDADDPPTLYAEPIVAVADDPFVEAKPKSNDEEPAAASDLDSNVSGERAVTSIKPNSIPS